MAGICSGMGQNSGKGNMVRENGRSVSMGGMCGSAVGTGKASAFWRDFLFFVR
jgi:hypothetical protein